MQRYAASHHEMLAGLDMLPHRHGNNSWRMSGCCYGAGLVQPFYNLKTSLGFAG